MSTACLNPISETKAVTILGQARFKFLFPSGTKCPHWYPIKSSLVTKSAFNYSGVGNSEPLLLIFVLPNYSVIFGFLAGKLAIKDWHSKWQPSQWTSWLAACPLKHTELEGRGGEVRVLKCLGEFFKRYHLLLVGHRKNNLFDQESQRPHHLWCYYFCPPIF